MDEPELWFIKIRYDNYTWMSTHLTEEMAKSWIISMFEAIIEKYGIPTSRVSKIEITRE